MKNLTIIESIEQLISSISQFRECEPTNRPIQLIHDELLAYLTLKAFVDKLNNAKSAFSGTFNLRISPILHAMLANEAHVQGVSMNALIERLLESHFDKENL